MLLSFKSALAPIPTKGAETPIVVAYTVCMSSIVCMLLIASKSGLIGEIPALSRATESNSDSKTNRAFF